jgi:general secretion pathway protein F
VAVYEYKGLDKAGKNATGIVDADSPKAARLKLRKQGVFPTSVVEAKGGALRAAGKGTTSASTSGGLSVEVDFSKYLERVSVGDIAIATRQLSALVGAGIPLVESLGAISEQVEKEKLRLIFREVKEKVNEGATLHKALAGYPKIFSNLYTNMVKAGEQAGALETVLDRLADYTESMVELRGKVVAAMTYPLIMMFVAMGVVGFLLTFVVPKITKLFDDMGADLPLITRVVVGISGFMQSYWWLLTLLAAAGYYAFRRWYATDSGRHKVDDVVLRIPVFGGMLSMVAISRFASTLATLMNAGVPLLSALGIVRNLLGNVILQDVVETAQVQVREGRALNRPLRESGRFPPMVIHMIAVGERTGDLAPMLERVSTSYESQVNRRLETLSSLLEPLMILIMGGVVFVIALSILLPMLNMNSLAR